jgi:hypothetical protein
LAADLLAHHRVGDGGFKSFDSFPFACRPDIAAGVASGIFSLKLSPSLPSMLEFLAMDELLIVKTIVAGT